MSVVHTLRSLAATTTTLFFLGAALFIGASFFPDGPLWGMNLLGYYSNAGRAAFILLALILGLSATVWLPAAEEVLGATTTNRRRLAIVAILLGTAAAFVFYKFRIATDIYGDARTLVSSLSNYQYTFGDVLTMNGPEPLTRLIHQSISQVFHLELAQTFQIVSSVAGGLFVALLVIFVANREGPPVWKVFLVILGLTTGANQLFFGHVEDYTLAYLAMYLFLALAWLSLEGKKVLGLASAVFVVGIALHAEMVLLAPVCAYLLAYRFKVHWRKRWLQPRILIRLVGLSFVAALFAYFFYFRAYRYEVGDYKELTQKVFLPLVNYHLEPHSYSMFSWKHLSDVVQEEIMTISPCALLVLIIAALYRRRIRWDQPLVVLFAIASCYLLLFNATVNPLLTMLRDWDFLALAGVPMTFLAAVVSRHLFNALSSETVNLRRLVGAGTGLAVFSCSLFFVNADHERVQRRLEGVGMWAYASYYSGSSYIINVAEQMIPDLSERLKRREKTIAVLEPYRSRPDLELGVLYHKLAETALAVRDVGKADQNFMKAFAEDSSNASALRGMALTALLSGQYDRADSLLEFYNANINRPVVVDSLGLKLAWRLTRARQLEPSAARNELDGAYNDYLSR